LLEDERKRFVPDVLEKDEKEWFDEPSTDEKEGFSDMEEKLEGMLDFHNRTGRPFYH
jgi:hypothetical protein